jgi:hypothetical protein
MLAYLQENRIQLTNYAEISDLGAPPILEKFSG